MANDLDKNPLVLDTVGQVLDNKNISIYSVQWVDPAAINDACVLRDQNGNTIFQATCVTAKQSLIKYFKPGFVYIGLNVVTLGSGALHVLTNYMHASGERVKPFKDQ